jgi:hypothetical protein
MNDTSAATALGEYLADTCFKGQNMDTSICSCVQVRVCNSMTHFCSAEWWFLQVQGNLGMASAPYVVVCVF